MQRAREKFEEEIRSREQEENKRLLEYLEDKIQRAKTLEKEYEPEFQ